MKRRVVITGLGAVTPIGNTMSDSIKAIKEGRHGFEKGAWFKDRPDEIYIKASVKNFSPEDYFSKKELRRTDWISIYAVATAIEALADAKTDFKDLDPYKVGVIIGSGIGGIKSTEEYILTYKEKGPDRISPFTVPMMIGNMPAGLVSIRTGFKGVSYCPVTACATSGHAIGEAYRAIKHGYIDAALAGGTESSQVGFAYAGFNNMRAMTRSKDPDRASIPFDKERNGFVLGEGACTLVLEEYEHALKRSANIYAEIKGYGATTDAYHETSPSPDGEGGQKAMEKAMEEAGFVSSDINYINAHGTSTPINDRVETLFIKNTLRENAKNVMVNSTKSFCGHLLGATSAFEAAVTAIQIKEGFVHKTLSYKVKDDDCDLDYVIEGNRKVEIKAALSNSLGFGGHNVCLAFSKL